jgi:hypothetical protein
MAVCARGTSICANGREPQGARASSSASRCRPSVDTSSSSATPWVGMALCHLTRSSRPRDHATSTSIRAWSSRATRGEPVSTWSARYLQSPSASPGLCRPRDGAGYARTSYYWPYSVRRSTRGAGSRSGASWSTRWPTAAPTPVAPRSSRRSEATPWPPRLYSRPRWPPWLTQGRGACSPTERSRPTR